MFKYFANFFVSAIKSCFGVRTTEFFIISAMDVFWSKAQLNTHDLYAFPSQVSYETGEDVCVSSQSN